MKDIQELLYIIRQNNLPLLNQNGQPLEQNSLLWRLCEGLEKGQFQTDEDARMALYPDDTSGSKFRQLKSVLKERLFSAVASFDAVSSDFSDYQKAYYQSHRQWLVVKILTGQNANTAAISLANKLLRQALKYEFTMLVMDIASYLSIQYSLREIREDKYLEANALFSKCRATYEAESLAEDLYTHLAARMVNKRTASNEVAQMATEYFARIEPGMRQFDSYRLHLYGNMIGLIRFTALNRHEEALPFCDSVIHFFKQKPYEARVPLQIFYYQKLISHIQLRQFREGEAVVGECLRIVAAGTFNWFKHMELYTQLAFHSGQYERGGQLLMQVMKHPRFQFLPENAVEIWRIFESYGHYLVQLGKIVKLDRRKFRLHRFLNEMPIFSRDKGGVNIAIVIVKFLFLLCEKRYSELLDEVEATEQYCYRYLSGDNTLRSFNFIKMLLQIPLAQFDEGLIEKRVERYRLKLEETPLQVANQTYEIEIIPYEVLWELALESVRANKV
jgi:hypothetical protein